MTALEALANAERIVVRNATVASRRDTLHKLRTGHSFANDYGRRLVNERAAGKFVSDPEMSEAISRWLWLIAEKDRKAAERAEALMAPQRGYYDYLRHGLHDLSALLDQGRTPSIVRMQFDAWLASTTLYRTGLEGRERRSIAAMQGAFNRRLRLSQAGVCP